MDDDSYVYDPEAHRARLGREADAAYWAAFAKVGAEEAYWARRRVYGYMYPAINYSRLGTLCYAPLLAPMDPGSVAEDMRYDRIFTIDHVESHFGDTTVLDTDGRWHEVENVRVIEWHSPADLEQRKQDLILARLEAAYGL